MKKKQTRGVLPSNFQRTAMASAIITATLASSACSSGGDDSHLDYYSKVADAAKGCAKAGGEPFCNCVETAIETIIFGLPHDLQTDLILKNQEAASACRSDEPAGRQRTKYWRDAW
ncbi:MAG: hypothetical protein M2R45_00377 [Verrucomicrobia subdivision 3 bacterium]|nr:hypothetical protein [Limisphaerales bacterium]MCS1412865.1 hypothetical protein [Limisphaerales bacterium]